MPLSTCKEHIYPKYINCVGTILNNLSGECPRRYRGKQTESAAYSNRDHTLVCHVKRETLLIWDRGLRGGSQSCHEPWSVPKPQIQATHTSRPPMKSRWKPIVQNVPRTRSVLWLLPRSDLVEALCVGPYSIWLHVDADRPQRRIVTRNEPRFRVASVKGCKSKVLCRVLELFAAKGQRVRISIPARN